MKENPQVPHFDVSKPMLGEITQSFQEVRKMARSIENTVTSLLPLTDALEVKTSLEAMQAEAMSIAGRATNIYNLIAREALRG